MPAAGATHRRLNVNRTAYHYVSSPQCVPLHDKKGSVIANISTFGLEPGYALTDNFNVFANGSVAGAPQLLNDGGKENSGHKSGLFRQYTLDAPDALHLKCFLTIILIMINQFNFDLLNSLVVHFKYG